MQQLLRRVTGKSNVTKRAVSSLATGPQLQHQQAVMLSAGAPSVLWRQRVTTLFAANNRSRPQQMSHRNKSDFAVLYEEHVKGAAERVPRPLNAEQVASVVELLDPPADEKESLLDLFVIACRLVDEAAYVVASSPLW